MADTYSTVFDAEKVAAVKAFKLRNPSSGDVVGMRPVASMANQASGSRLAQKGYRTIPTFKSSSPEML
jgi:hypothetical protein